MFSRQPNIQHSHARLLTSSNCRFARVQFSHSVGIVKLGHPTRKRRDPVNRRSGEWRCNTLAFAQVLQYPPRVRVLVQPSVLQSKFHWRRSSIVAHLKQEVLRMARLLLQRGHFSFPCCLATLLAVVVVTFIGSTATSDMVPRCGSSVGLNFGAQRSNFKQNAVTKTTGQLLWSNADLCFPCSRHEPKRAGKELTQPPNAWSSNFACDVGLETPIVRQCPRSIR